MVADRMVGGLPAPRHAALRLICDPETGEQLDEALILFFPAGASVTGEDLLELQCHGSRAVVSAIESALSTLPNVRPAAAGEFTRRAFESGRMDLSRIEGLGDLLAAETVAQRRAAFHMMEGKFAERINEWRGRLLQVAANLEARIDFADEEDVAHNSKHDDLVDLLASLDLDLARPAGESLRKGFRIVIAGPPNAGKSSLFNALIGREAAIVTDIAGTTRDLVEAPMTWDGYPFILIDSAGLRDNETVDAVEAIGIGRAARAIDQADIILWLGSPDTRPDRGGVIQVAGKADLGTSAEGVAVSSVTGVGLDLLVGQIVEHARILAPAPTDYALSLRQHDILTRVRGAVAESIEQDDEVLRAELVRTALFALTELTGENATEAMFDTLFSGFCIGK
jgi:tRNA modification GTPase